MVKRNTLTNAIAAMMVMGLPRDAICEAVGLDRARLRKKMGTPACKRLIHQLMDRQLDLATFVGVQFHYGTASHIEVLSRMAQDLGCGQFYAKLHGAKRAKRLPPKVQNTPPPHKAGLPTLKRRKRLAVLAEQQSSP
jgi:hypothetical protein